MKKSKHLNNNKAFTLVEMAVVILIMGLIAGIGAGAYSDIESNAKQAATQNKLDAIEKALYNFWVKNGRLPAPADATLASTHASFGVSGTANFTSATNTNKASEGAVPFKTLGLPADFMFDGWKRKIAYAVTPEFTMGLANKIVQPKNSVCFANTAIRIRDASGTDRSTSAMYALISYGENGHGAYLASGSTRYSASSSNTDEQTNCHCDSSAANTTYDGNYVQRSQNLNKSTAANYFDDIVRYKERWQMASNEDVFEDDGYRGPDLAVAMIEATNGTAYVYKNQCGQFIKQADLSPLPTNEVRGIAFTNGNKHLLVYSAAGCNLYKINKNGTLTNLPSAFATACPYNATAVMTLSNNGYLAISSGTSSATINLWKQAGDSFIALSNITHSDASVKELSFSLDANLLAVRSNTTSSLIYKRKADSFSVAAADITQPSGLSSVSAPESLVLSPDGKYLASLEWDASVNNTKMRVWRIDGGRTPSFTKLTQEFVPGDWFNYRYYNLTFSPDSRYYISNSNRQYSAVNYIYPNDMFAREYINIGLYDYITSNIILSTLSGASNLIYSFSKKSVLLAESRQDASISLKIFKNYSNGVTGYTYSYYPYSGAAVFEQISRKFRSDGTTGTSPVRSYNQHLSGATTGVVAFAN